MLGSNEVIKIELSDDKVIGTIFLNVDGITLGVYDGADMVSLDGSFDGVDYGKLEVLFFGDLLRYNDGKFIGSDEGIKLVIYDGKVLGAILVNLDGVTLGIDVRTDQIYLYGSFYGFNDGKLERLFLGDSL